MSSNPNPLGENWVIKYVLAQKMVEPWQPFKYQKNVEGLTQFLNQWGTNPYLYFRIPMMKIFPITMVRMQDNVTETETNKWRKFLKCVNKLIIIHLFQARQSRPRGSGSDFAWGGNRAQLPGLNFFFEFVWIFLFPNHWSIKFVSDIFQGHRKGYFINH